MDSDTQHDPESDVRARDAIAYAANTEFLVLFGVLLIGWIVTTIGTWIYTAPGRVMPEGFRIVLGVPVTLLGATIVFLGCIAVGYKLLRDGTNTSF